MAFRIYFDVCCLNRPFDDQSQGRIRMESEAVILLLKSVDEGDFTWVASEVLEYEISRTPNMERRKKVLFFARKAEIWVPLNGEVARRAKWFEGLGFGPFDALHVASAESEKVQVFLTTDDKLLKLGQRHADKFNVAIVNPMVWLLEARNGI